MSTGMKRPLPCSHHSVHTMLVKSPMGILMHRIASAYHMGTYHMGTYHMGTYHMGTYPIPHVTFHVGTRST